MRIKDYSSLKKIILVLFIVNIAVALLLMKNHGIMPFLLEPQAAVASDNDKNKEVADEDSEAEVTDEEKAAKAAEAAKLVLDGLEEKRIQLQKQEDKVKEEQAKLIALKKELEDKIVELEKIHKLIEINLQKLNIKKSEKELQKQAQDARKIKQLVKVYSSMKPKQAGAIFNNMDIVVAEKIFMNMKGDAAGKILSYVESSRAAKISERLAVTISKEENNL